MNNAVSKTGLKDRWSLIRVVFILKFDCICEGEPEAEFLGPRDGGRISGPRAGGRISGLKNRKQNFWAQEPEAEFLRPEQGAEILGLKTRNRLSVP